MVKACLKLYNYFAIACDVCLYIYSDKTDFRLTANLYLRNLLRSDK